jgi:hypothetical protein
MTKRMLGSLIIGLLFAVEASAATSIQRTTIANLQLNKGYPNVLFIQLTGTPSGNSCSAGGWHYTLSLTGTDGPQMYAMLLMAYSTGALLNIQGSGTCPDVGNIESADVVQLTQ